MQVSVETKEGLEREMTVEFPMSDMNAEVNTRLQSLTKTARINGFRPGKIPMSVIKKRYSAAIKHEVLNEELQKSYFEAIKQEALKPAGQPNIDLIENDDKDNVSYKAVFEVYPEITITSLDGQAFEKANVVIADDDIDLTIKNIRKQDQTFNTVDRAVQDEDQVIVDFVATIEGEAFKGNEGKQVPVILGERKMIEGFEEGVKGAKAGDKVTLNLKFPDDYHYADVAGKDVHFAINILEVQEVILPELNDAFYLKFGVADGGNDAFRAEVKNNMQIELDKAIAAKIKNQVMDAIIEVNDILAPKALVEEEATYMAKQMQEQYKMQDQSDASLQTAMFEEQATKRVSLGLLLAEIIRVKEITASEEAVMNKVKEFAVTYENPQEVINYYMSDKNKLAEMESFVLEERVVDWACEQGNMANKDYSFTEFMNTEKKRPSINS